jgi:hypothetical protein
MSVTGFFPSLSSQEIDLTPANSTKLGGVKPGLARTPGKWITKQSGARDEEVVYATVRLASVSISMRSSSPDRDVDSLWTTGATLDGLAKPFARAHVAILRPTQQATARPTRSQVFTGRRLNLEVRPRGVP